MRRGVIFGVEDAPDILNYFGPRLGFGEVSHGVLDGVEMAALPRHAGHGCLPGRLEAGMLVANDWFHAVHAALLEAPE
jgi:hypothetical protein